MDAASNTGFRRIADFIFGNNRAASSDASAKIGMTAPVAVEPQALTSMQSVMQWRIHFVMPSHYTLATLPQPNNPLVQIKELPAKTFVVHRYSGFNTISRVQIKTDETLAWMQREGLRALGTPQLSRYDPPWTLPMFRRNEIWVEIEAPNANSKN
jgi:hypothetical protein